MIFRRASSCRLRNQAGGLDFNPIRDHYNARHNWADPLDPARAQLVRSDYESKLSAQLKKEGLDVPITSREDITDHIRQYVEAGIINNRDDVIACLTEDVGIITRSAKHFVSVLPKNEKKAIRLRGLYFEQDFNTEPRPGATDAGQDDRTDFKGSKYVRPTTQGARDEFNAAYQRRRKFHIKRLQQAERNRSNRSVSVLAGAADSRPVLDPRPDAWQRDGHQCIDVDDRRTSPDAAANGTGDSEPEYRGASTYRDTRGSLYLITQPGAPRPGVYPHQQYPDRWVVRIEEE